MLITAVTVMSTASAQLFVGPASLFGNYNADSLVRNILMSGGVNVSNVMFNGSTGVINCNAIGKFSTGSNGTNMGLASGVIMATGDVTVAMGPNSTGSADQSSGCSSYSDQALNNIAGVSLNDVAVLEFDFVPWSDTLSFRFVFASEEYPEFVNAGYNDAFGFFVTGLNPNGGTYNNFNVALVPGTANVPITIDNVNANSYPQYYVDNTGGATIEYDGFTTIITAVVHVVPYNSYHMKFAIGDAGDSAYQSAVFLEANSFATNFEQEMEVDYVLYPDIPAGTYYCAQGPIVFSPVTNCNYDQMVWYFGDGTHAYGDTVQHVYGYPGFYNVMNVIRSPHRDEDTMYIERVIEIRQITAEVTESVCNQYVWYDQNGVDSVVYETSGVYVDTLVNDNGCDSIVTLYLTINTAPAPHHLYGHTTMETASDLFSGNYTFSIDSVPGATSYEWTLTGENNWPLITHEDDPLKVNIIATGIGTGTLTVSAYSECGVGTLEAYMTASPSGVDDITADNAISIMPNPTNGNVVISLDPSTVSAEVLVYNSNGQKVDAFEMTSNSMSYSMDKFESGLYFFRVNAEGKQYSKKVVLTR